jgi:3-hydroxyacyl-[acyl-carrier-protein] dehydratase
MLAIGQTVPQASPLTEHVQLLRVETSPDGAVHVSSRVCLDAGNPIFAGHYPGLALVPGVCLIEFVHRTVLMVAQLRGVSLVLHSVVSARFLNPVSPGENVNAELVVIPGATGWDVKAALHGQVGAAATVSLRCTPSRGA